MIIRLNQPDAAPAVIVSRLQNGYLWRGVADPEYR